MIGPTQESLGKLSKLGTGEIRLVSFEIPVQVCSGIITGKGSTHGDAVASILAKIDDHNLSVHVNQGSEPCLKAWLPMKRID